MKKIKKLIIGTLITAFSVISFSKEIASVNTAWGLTGSDQIKIEALKDDLIDGVTCHISYAKKGGISGLIGEDPSKFSIACRQTNQIVFKSDLSDKEDIASFSRNPFFKKMKVTRIIDKENNSLVYLIWSDKLIDGSAFNSISTVPMQPWGNREPITKFRR